MKKILTFTLILWKYLIFSQNFKDQKNIFPFTPETSSLIKYQEIPVSNYTGIANISIPIYTIKTGNLEIPLSLTYHSGGILLSDIASSTGLGWSINTISPITRKINGFTDENGIMLHNNSIEDFITQNKDNQQLRLNLATNILTNESIADLMPDEFNLSINEFSGSFLYQSKDQKFVTFPISDLKITPTIKNIGSTRQINTIDINTNGVVYTYGDDGIETFTYMGSVGSSTAFGANTWKIKKVKAIDGKEIIFSYLSNNIYKREAKAHQKTIPYKIYSSSIGCGALGTVEDDPTNYDDSQYNMKEALIEKIETSDVSIYFNYTNREDFNDLKKLDKITIINKAGQIISEKKFNYNYFQVEKEASGVIDPTENPTKKLKLISYEECDRDNKCLVTSFKYYEEYKMYERLSKASDHWGYFNNRPNNNGFPNVPIKYLDIRTNNSLDGFTSDVLSPQYIANKDVNPDYVKTYSLKSITYPEGGTNEFIYEPNIASSLFYDPKEEHYFLARKKTIKKSDGFAVSGYVEKDKINIGSPSSPTSFNHYSNTYVKEIDLSRYNKELALRLTKSSNFKGSYFSQHLGDSSLYAEVSIYYYENGIKKYWIQDSRLDDFTEFTYTKFNNSQIPNDKVYLEIKHTYWGGLGDNRENYIPFSSQILLEWEEDDPNSIIPIIYGGGIRIKEIKQYDNNGQYKYSSKYSYTKEESSQQSSGILFNIPMYTKNSRIGSIRSSSCPDGRSGVTKIIKEAIQLSVKPIISGLTTQGKSVGYSNVEVVRMDANNRIKGREIYKYYAEPPYQTGDNFLASTDNTSARYEFMENRDWRNGQLIKYIAFNDKNDVIKTVERDFYTAGPPSATTDYYAKRNIKSILYNLISPIHYVPGGFPLDNIYAGPTQMDPDVYVNGIYSPTIGLNNPNSNKYLPVFTKHNDAFLLKKEIISDYFNGNNKIKVSKYNYNNSDYPTILTSKTDTFVNEDNTSETTYQYAHEKGNQYLIDKNMIGIPLQTSVTQKQNDNDPGKTISKSEILYPTSQADANARTSGLALPVSVLGFDIQNPEDAAKAQTELTYDLYDNKGNILQYSVKGKPVTVIWGYNQTQPIAKIEGAAYNQVSAYVSAIIAASDADNTQGTDQSEQALIGALDILRNNTALSAYQITTYSYNPLIGVTSITPPSGIREIYKYDSANRLESVKDVNGNLLKEYQYRYKN